MVDIKPPNPWQMTEDQFCKTTEKQIISWTMSAESRRAPGRLLMLIHQELKTRFFFYSHEHIPHYLRDNWQQLELNTTDRESNAKTNIDGFTQDKIVLKLLTANVSVFLFQSILMLGVTKKNIKTDE